MVWGRREGRTYRAAGLAGLGLAVSGGAALGATVVLVDEFHLGLWGLCGLKKNLLVFLVRLGFWFSRRGKGGRTGVKSLHEARGRGNL